jgi:hypothetical protein
LNTSRENGVLTGQLKDKEWTLFTEGIDSIYTGADIQLVRVERNILGTVVVCAHAIRLYTSQTTAA